MLLDFKVVNEFLIIAHELDSLESRFGVSDVFQIKQEFVRVRQQAEVARVLSDELHFAVVRNDVGQDARVFGGQNVRVHRQDGKAQLVERNFHSLQAMT